MAARGGLEPSNHLSKPGVAGVVPSPATPSKALRRACLKGTRMKTVERWHGTITGYKRHSCRCADCRGAYSAYQREYRDANREKVAAWKRAHYASNRERLLAKQRAYRDANPDVIRAWHAENRDRVSAKVRLRKYGISDRRFAAMVVAQGGRCAICDQGFGSKPPHVDHDHACCAGSTTCGKCIRGLLCGQCNRGLGLFGDDASRIARAVGYLRGQGDTE